MMVDSCSFITSVSKKTKFSLSLRQYDRPEDRASRFYVSYQDPEIEYHHTSVSYDIFSYGKPKGKRYTAC